MSASRSQAKVFRCAGCGGVFKLEDDTEARAELREHFGDVPVEDCALVCDDCYAEMVG